MATRSREDCVSAPGEAPRRVWRWRLAKNRWWLATIYDIDPVDGMPLVQFAALVDAMKALDPLGAGEIELPRDPEDHALRLVVWERQENPVRMITESAEEIPVLPGT